MEKFTHYDEQGCSRMVDVSQKPVTLRTAKAIGYVSMKEETIRLIRERLIPKGNVFEVARIAGIMGAKKAHELIPMCHPLQLHFVDVRFEIDDEHRRVMISSEVRLEGKTGAEMEALVAVTIAALTVYDMCKAVDKTMAISDVRVISKTGGKSGDFAIQME
ncbi:MAG: cyclic pyranopterin monophosphate synthase MoaC [Spirochaetes bacterium]|nr:cyclic pyranopterin monophosphate synthase MoaC [Spirochaetota bacterium]